MVCVPVRRYNPGNINCIGTQTMLYLTCTMISSVDIAHYRVSHAKDWVSMDCGTSQDVMLTFALSFLLLDASMT